ncbi:hypothetical protein NEHOM01_1773 [Nematocida homosporus]|uniref:uncharacterized protein n=1 Tax=Nematocida homosporus TaxID=1912981 RepID=UPI00221F1AAB|nr:uncharacterized protein NEHOM01_1773 [Nematocida homosporus]KAI5186884.1 hypothetical protein NEHOM01_1773 [Nematocida homosporus]
MLNSGNDSRATNEQTNATTSPLLSQSDHSGQGPSVSHDATTSVNASSTTNLSMNMPTPSLPQANIQRGQIELPFDVFGLARGGIILWGIVFGNVLCLSIAISLLLLTTAEYIAMSSSTLRLLPFVLIPLACCEVYVTSTISACYIIRCTKDEPRRFLLLAGLVALLVSWTGFSLHQRVSGRIISISDPSDMRSLLVLCTAICTIWQVWGAICLLRQSTSAQPFPFYNQYLQRKSARLAVIVIGGLFRWTLTLALYFLIPLAISQVNKELPCQN